MVFAEVWTSVRDTFAEAQRGYPRLQSFNMQLNSILLILLSLALSSSTRQAMTNITIFSPPSDYLIPRVLYARTVQLEDGTLLATWENYSSEPPKVFFPIYRSTDNGASWKHISNVTDT